jgi:hypothetical protein
MSVPDSFRTGADSPVIADSFTKCHTLNDFAVGRNDLIPLDPHDITLA